MRRRWHKAKEITRSLRESRARNRKPAVSPRALRENVAPFRLVLFFFFFFLWCGATIDVCIY